MSASCPDWLRDAGYETLFLLGGFLALSIHPTRRNLEDIFQWIDESQSRRQLLRRLESRGLVESGERQGQWVASLTDRGRSAFAGGRDPEAAWTRSWDGRWRLLTFDLPRRESRSRLKLWRWSKEQHLGHLQGSVWIAPHPVPALEQFMKDCQIEPGSVLVFEGSVVGSRTPRELASAAWDFEALNRSYRHYIDFAERAGRSVPDGAQSLPALQEILREDRKRWWDAVRRDPLLPKPLHPADYQGPAAWKSRGKLLKKLGKSFNTAKALREP